MVATNVLSQFAQRYRLSKVESLRSRAVNKLEEQCLSNSCMQKVRGRDYTREVQATCCQLEISTRLHIDGKK